MMSVPAHNLNSLRCEFFVIGRIPGDLFVPFVRSDGTIKRTTEISSTTPSGPAVGASGRFGASVAIFGDLGGNGGAGIAAGAPSSDSAYIMFTSSSSYTQPFCVHDSVMRSVDLVADKLV